MAKSKKYPKPPMFVVGEGGTTFIDLSVKASSVEILVSEPGMSVVEFVSVTDVEHNEAVPDLMTAFNALASELTATSYCGHTGLSHIAPGIRNHRLAPQLVIGVGTTGMYQNRLTIKTTCGQALDKVIRRTLVGTSRRAITFGLMPVIQMSSHHSHNSHSHSGHVQAAIS